MVTEGRPDTSADAQMLIGLTPTIIASWIARWAVRDSRSDPACQHNRACRSRRIRSGLGIPAFTGRQVVVIVLGEQCDRTHRGRRSTGGPTVTSTQQQQRTRHRGSGAPRCWARRCYDAHVRTTVNIRDDLHEAARRRAFEDRRTFGDVINDLIEAGLADHADRETRVLGRFAGQIQVSPDFDDVPPEIDAALDEPVSP